MLSRLLSFLSVFPLSFPISQQRRKDDRNRLVRRIVRNLARGNMSLQRGEFVTSSDIERLRAENNKHDFAKSR